MDPLIIRLVSACTALVAFALSQAILEREWERVKQGT